uniref:Uncharacterized protein n=1 Tax=Sphaeramia orbicularis TaxID=375764 RepID=A0A672Y6K9_9TELE
DFGICFKAIHTSGGFLNDRLTPEVRFRPWATPLLGPIAPMVSSDDCRGLTGIPVTQITSAAAVISRSCYFDRADKKKHTSSNQSELVFLISNLLLLNISSWEEKSHHPFEELIHELDGERHHIHLMREELIIHILHNTECV